MYSWRIPCVSEEMQSPTLFSGPTRGLCSRYPSRQALQSPNNLVVPAWRILSLTTPKTLGSLFARDCLTEARYPPIYVFSCACNGPPSSKCSPGCLFASHLVSPSLCFCCTTAASLSSPAAASTTSATAGARASGHRRYFTLQERHSKTFL